MKVEDKIQYIEDNKAKISYYIASTFSDLMQDQDDLWQMFGDFTDKIKDSGVFVIENFDYKTSYEKKVGSLVSKLEEFFPGLADDYELNERLISLADPFVYYKRENYPHVGDEEIDRLTALYAENLTEYTNCHVWANMFYDFMLEDKGAHYKEMLSLIKQLDQEIVNYNKKVARGYIREEFSFTSTINRYSRFFTKYHLKNSDDLLNLLTEINSFTIDENLLDENEKKVVETNKDNYRTRMGKDSEYNLPVGKANKMKKSIEKIYNDNMFNDLYKKSNFGDFFEYFNVKSNKKNIMNLATIFVFNFPKSMGLNFYENFGDGEKNYSLYLDEVFSKKYLLCVNVIIHELVHCLERVYNDELNENNFNFKYSTLNEILTEYISRESTKRFCGVSEYNDEERFAAYDDAVTILDFIKGSQVFKDLIKCKLYNSDAPLVKRIGKRNMKKLEELLRYPWSNRLTNKRTTALKEALTEFINEVDINNQKKSKR